MMYSPLRAHLMLVILALGSTLVSCQVYDEERDHAPEIGATEYEATAACMLGPENTDAACSDGIDNDGDPYIDCNDFDCCGNGLTVCDNCGNNGTPDYPDSCTGCGGGPACAADEACCGGTCIVPACESNADCTGGDICQDAGTCNAMCAPPPPSPPAGVEKIMAYNIKAGGIDPAWKDVIKDENADVIFFVETEDWNQAKVDGLVAEFNDYFSTGAYASPNDEPPYFAHAEPNAPPYGGTAILSRYPIVSVTIVDSLVLDNNSSWAPIRDFMIWELDIDGRRVHTTAVHPKCCSGSSNESQREKDIEGLVNWFDSNVPNGDIIIAGDFNAFSYADQAAGNNLGDLGYGPLEILLDENPGDSYDARGSTRHLFYDGYRELVPTISSADHTYRVNPYNSRIDFIIMSDGLQPLLTPSASVGAGTSNDPGSDHWTVDIHLDFGGGGPPPAEVCSNDIVETAEVCDGTDLAGQTCESLGFYCGTLACQADCLDFDTSACVAGACGDGILQCGEVCDGANLGGETCVSRGYESGTLACLSDCSGFDESACVAPACTLVGDACNSDAECCSNNCHPKKKTCR